MLAQLHWAKGFGAGHRQGQIGSKMNYNGPVFMTRVTLQVGGPRLWSSLERDGCCQDLFAQDILHEYEPGKA